MKREILKTLQSIDKSLKLIENRIESIEKSGATKAETVTISVALSEFKEDFNNFRTRFVEQQERKIKQLEESETSLENRVLSLERAVGVR